VREVPPELMEEIELAVARAMFAGLSGEQIVRLSKGTTAES